MDIINCSKCKLCKLRYSNKDDKCKYEEDSGDDREIEEAINNTYIANALIERINKQTGERIVKEEEKALVQTLKSHFWAHGSGVGKVSEFESKFNRYVGSDECVAVSNGTLDLGTWEQIFYGEFDGKREKRILVKVIGE